MSGQPVKLLEGLILLGAIAVFAWWQLREVNQAQKEAAKRRENQTGVDANRKKNEKESV